MRGGLLCKPPDAGSAEKCLLKKLGRVFPQKGGSDLIAAREAYNGDLCVIKRGCLSMAVAIIAAGFALTDLVAGAREFARLITYSCAGFSVVSFLLSLFEEAKQRGTEQELVSTLMDDRLQLKLNLEYDAAGT